MKVRNLRLSLLVALIFNIFVGCQSANSEELSETSLAILKTLPFCKSGRADVPPEMIAGVVIAENQLNRGIKDTLQDTLFEALLKYHDEGWWSTWHDRSSALARNADAARLSSNKWSADVVATGFVFSIGPAQITPRTAFIACGNVTNPPAVCLGSAKQLVNNLLEKGGAVELAAVILSSEASTHMKLSGIDVSREPALWATLYNLGGDYFRANHRVKSNSFGIWVANHMNKIREILDCGPGRD